MAERSSTKAGKAPRSSVANKTQPTGQAVESFLAAIPDAARREDARVVDALMRDATGCAPRMWGSSIVGYGSYRYRYASGREGDWMITGFSPRKAALVLYIMPGFARFDALMAKLGRYTTGKSCLYVKRLDQVDLDVLRELVVASVAHMRDKYDTTG